MTVCVVQKGETQTFLSKGVCGRVTRNIHEFEEGPCIFRFYIHCLNGKEFCQKRHEITVHPVVPYHACVLSFYFYSHGIVLSFHPSGSVSWQSQKQRYLKEGSNVVVFKEPFKVHERERSISTPHNFTLKHLEDRHEHLNLANHSVGKHHETQSVKITGSDV